MKRMRMKKTTKQYITVALICILVIGSAAILTTVFVTRNYKIRYEDLLSTARSEMERNKRTVYITTADISSGQILSAENTKKETVYSSQPQGLYITSDDLGKMTLVDLPQGAQIIKSMLTANTVTTELRELQYDVIMINSNIVSEDTVDIRIQYPNGESRVVLNKKVIKGLAEGAVTCYLWLNPEEILRMSAAIVDAAQYAGTKLITAKYIEPAVQEASMVTYVPSLAILDLIENDPNIVEKSSQKLNKEVRKALENRLAESMANDVTQISWDVNPNIESTVPKSEESEKEDTDKKDTEKKDSEPEESPETYEHEENSSDLESGETTDYFYYTEEQKAKDGEMEYGE